MFILVCRKTLYAGKNNKYFNFKYYKINIYYNIFYYFL